MLDYEKTKIAIPFFLVVSIFGFIVGLNNKVTDLKNKVMLQDAKTEIMTEIGHMRSDIEVIKTKLDDLKGDDKK